MKKIYSYLLLPLVTLLVVGCDDDDDKLPAVRPADRGTVVDNEGNTYGWVRIGDLLWTTSNAKNGPNVWDCQYFDRSQWKNLFSYYGYPDYDLIDDYVDNYMPDYGNLMNYEGAVASAPDGWRLPSDEDWQKLERYLGMSDTDKKGARGNGQAFRLQEKDSGTELAMLLGGGLIFEPSYGMLYMNLQYQDVYGFYWTSTPDPTDVDGLMAYYRKFLSGNGSIWRECCSTQQLFSVRWVKDAE